MKDAPLVRANSNSNHAMWVLGHTTVVEGRLHKTLFGTANPVEHWKPLFDAGSEPSDDPAVYPPFEEVLKKYRELRREDIGLCEHAQRCRFGSPRQKSPARTGKAFRHRRQCSADDRFAPGISQWRIFGGPPREAGKQPVFVPTKEFRES